MGSFPPLDHQGEPLFFREWRESSLGAQHLLRIVFFRGGGGTLTPLAGQPWGARNFPVPFEARSVERHIISFVAQPCVGVSTNMNLTASTCGSTLAVDAAECTFVCNTGYDANVDTVNCTGTTDTPTCTGTPCSSVCFAIFKKNKCPRTYLHRGRTLLGVFTSGPFRQTPPMLCG